MAWRAARACVVARIGSVKRGPMFCGRGKRRPYGEERDGSARPRDIVRGRSKRRPYGWIRELFPNP